MHPDLPLITMMIGAPLLFLASLLASPAAAQAQQNPKYVDSKCLAWWVAGCTIDTSDETRSFTVYWIQQKANIQFSICYPSNWDLMDQKYLRNICNLAGCFTQLLCVISFMKIACLPNRLLKHNAHKKISWGLVNSALMKIAKHYILSTIYLLIDLNSTVQLIQVSQLNYGCNNNHGWRWSYKSRVW